MKALSLWQPWASLLVLGIKRYETRGWGTDYRGEFAVHAAGYWGPLCQSLFDLPTVRAALEPHGITKVEDLPFGAVLGTAELRNIVPTELVVPALSMLERLLGNYADGRRAWELGEVRRFNTPIPARGRQGLWEWTAPAAADLSDCLMVMK